MNVDDWNELIQQITDEIVDFTGDKLEMAQNQGLYLAIGIIYKFMANHILP